MKKTTLLFWLVLIAVSCGDEKNNSNDTAEVKQIEKFKPKPLMQFLSDEELDSVVNLPSDKSHVKGFRAWPQSGDDFRKDTLDNVFWEDLIVRNADFRGATFRSARCAYSDFSGSDFRVADIRWTKFDYGVLENCNFNQAKLFHVLADFAKFNGSSFRSADLFGMEAKYAYFRNCDFTGALLKDAEFKGSDFTGSVFHKARLIRTVMPDAILDSTKMYFADMTGAQFQRASFKGAKLTGSDMQGTHLEGADFSGADLKDVNFYKAKFDSTNFNGAINIPREIKKIINKKGFATGSIQAMNLNKSKN